MTSTTANGQRYGIGSVSLFKELERTIIDNIPSLSLDAQHLSNPDLKQAVNNKRIKLNRYITDRIFDLSIRRISRSKFNALCQPLVTKEVNERELKQALRVVLDNVLSSSYTLLTLRYFIYATILKFSSEYIDNTTQKAIRIIHNTNQHRALFDYTLASAAQYGVLRQDAVRVFVYITKNFSRMPDVRYKISRYSASTFSTKSRNNVIAAYMRIHATIHSFIKLYVRKKLRFITLFYSGVTREDLENDLIVRVLKVYYNLQPCTLPEAHVISYLCCTVKSFAVNIIDAYTSQKRSVIAKPDAMDDTQDSIHKPHRSHSKVCVSNDLFSFGDKKSDNGGSNSELSDNTAFDLYNYAQSEYNTLYGLSSEDYARLELDAIIRRYDSISTETLFRHLTLIEKVNVKKSVCDKSEKQVNITYDKARMINLVFSYDYSFTAYLRENASISDSESNLDLIHRFTLKTIVYKAMRYVKSKPSVANSLIDELNTVFSDTK